MTPPDQATVASVTDHVERMCPPALAESWDRIGLVLGDPDRPVTRALLVIDCVPETVEEAVDLDVDLIISHHQLLLRGVNSVAPADYKGRAVHRLIRAGIALLTAHTNADATTPGVSDALAVRLGLRDLSPLRPVDGAPYRGSGRIGRLPEPTTLTALVDRVADALPPTAWGVRATGDPDRLVARVAVCGGSGDAFLADATRLGADAYLTADLRHHPASEHASDPGPALIDAAHWATERPWLDTLAEYLRSVASIDPIVSDRITDPWTMHAKPSGIRPEREPNT